MLALKPNIRGYKCYCPHCNIELARTWFYCGGIKWCDSCGGQILWEVE